MDALQLQTVQSGTKIEVYFGFWWNENICFCHIKGCFK